MVIDKPGGMTSHDVVSRLRRITGERSIGHLGTLDPMATGVLPLLMGKFTRLAQYFSSAEKSYSGTIRFGFATDTYDAEGEADGPTVLIVDARHRCARRPRAFMAKWSRCRRRSPPKKSLAPRPTSWRAKGSRSSSKPAKILSDPLKSRHSRAEAAFHHEHQRGRLRSLRSA